MRGASGPGCNRKRSSSDAINALIGESSGVTKVVKNPRKFERRFVFELNQPKQLLVPLAESAAPHTGSSAPLHQLALDDVGIEFALRGIRHHLARRH
jgi:hypothetical protein